MDVQTALNFEIGQQRRDSLRVALKPYRLPEWTVELIVLLACDGRPREIAGQQCYELSISKRKAAQALGCAPNTFVSAAARLQKIGVLEIVQFGQQRTYFLSRDRLNDLAPIADDPVDELGLFAEPPTGHPPDRSRVVSGGQSARVREQQENLSRVRERVPCKRARGGTDQPLRSLSDEQVRTFDKTAWRAAFLDAVGQGWLQNEYEDKRKFLAVCHHAAKAQNIHYPARVVYAAVKNYDFERVSQASWDWAAEYLRSRQEVS